MIADFADEMTRDIYDGSNTKAARRVPRDIWGTAIRKLDQLNRVKNLEDLRHPPGNKLELLKGDLAGFYSIRVNAQFRIVFQFSSGSATKVRIVDYH